MNAVLGIFFHAIGGFAAGSFYMPYNKVKNWAWEVFWIIGGFFSWIIAPWVVAWLTIPDLPAVINQIFTNPDITSNILWAYIFGVLWGFGGLTFGLTMRYLGMSLGMALALGLTATFGTLIPPIFHGQMGTLFTTNFGITTLIGIVIALVGIVIVGKAGKQKDDSLPDEVKKKAIKEFNYRKGILVAIFSGIMSACFAFGLDAGKPIADMSIAQGTPVLFQNSAVLIVVLAGGFTTNFIWCLSLMIKNETYKQIVSLKPAQGLRNLLFSALAGTTWYFQFMFYGMGSSKLGRSLDFASWTIHMAFIIIFSTMWGLILKEWMGAQKETKRILLAGLLILIFSTVIIGFASYLKTYS
jgi:L-rhamnose-H+ transport protein